MESYIISALKQLECTPKEMKLFLASYKLGPATIPDIAKKAKLQRSTAYLLADQLIQKQLLTHDSNAYAKQLIAASPDTLLRLLDTKRRKISRTSMTLTDNIEEIRSLYGTSDIMPRISVYHGVSGLRTARSHILGAKTEILLWTNQATEQHIFTPMEHETFVMERANNEIKMRVLAVNNEAGQALIPADEKWLRHTKLLPAATTFSAETYIFDQKVVILDFTADIIAIVIENSSVHQAQKAIFELTWQTT